MPQQCYYSPVLLLTFISGAKISVIKKKENKKTEAQPNLHFARTAYLDHDASISITHTSVILHSIYNMLQLGNPQHIFSWHKRQMEIMEKTGQNSNRCSRSNWALTLFRNTSKQVRILAEKPQHDSFYPFHPASNLPRGKENVYSQK